MGTLVVANNVVDTLLGKMNDCKIATDSIAYKMGQIVEHSEYTTEEIQQLINIKNQELDQTIFGLPIPIATIIIPTTISIIIFILGVIFSKLSQKNKKRAELISYKDSIVDWVDKLKGSIQQQQLNIEDLIKKINSSDELQPEAFSQNLIILNKLKEISLKEWSDIIVINLKGDELVNRRRMTNVVYYIEYIDAIYRETQDFYWRYHNGMEEIRKEWNANYFGLTDKTWQNKCTNQTLLFTLNTCIKNSTSSSVQEQIECLIIPMKDFLLNPSNQSQDPNSLAIALSYIQKLEFLIQQWKVHNSGNVELFTEKKKQLFTLFQELQKYIKEIDDTEIVSFIKIK